MDILSVPLQPATPPPLSPLRRGLIVGCCLTLAGLFFVPWIQPAVAAVPDAALRSVLSHSLASAEGTFLWLLPGSALLLAGATVTRRPVLLFGFFTALLHVAFLSNLALVGGGLFARFTPGGNAVSLVSVLLMLLTVRKGSFDAEPTLGRLNRRLGSELRHWYAYVEDFKTSPQEFYERVREEISRRQLPKVDANLTTRAEGLPFLSADRVYLRLRRTDMAYDLCAAPFGTGFFFSFRVSLLPINFGLLDLLVLIFGFGYGGMVLLGSLGPVRGGQVVIGLLVFLALGLWGAPRYGLAWLDDLLLALPVIGPIYYHFFRIQTAYRRDTALVYLQAVERIFRRQVDELTLARGVKLSRTFDCDNVLGGAYEERPKELAVDLANPLRFVNDAEHP